VYTIGDYGNMYTAIGFFQFIREHVRLIDYFYHDEGIGVQGICKMFDGKPYTYAKVNGHWLPPDYHPIHGSNKHSLGTGRSILAEFGRHGYHMDICEPHSFDAGVKVTREVIPVLRVNKARCSDFWESMLQYKYKRNMAYSTEQKPAFSQDPQPGPHTHPADMIRYASWIYRFQLQIDNLRVGSPIPLVVSGFAEPRRANYYDRCQENAEVWG
jgi:hypothetical protein